MRQRESFKNIFSVFENLELIPAWAYRVRDGKTIETTKYSPSKYSLDVSGNEGEFIHISIAYHPAWKAFAGGAEIKLQNSNELIEMLVPNENVKLVTLVYTIDKTLPLVLFCIGMISLVVFYYVLSIKSYINNS
jgi:hypothetical protein